MNCSKIYVTRYVDILRRGGQKTWFRDAFPSVQWSRHV